MRMAMINSCKFQHTCREGGAMRDAQLRKSNVQVTVPSLQTEQNRTMDSHPEEDLIKKQQHRVPPYSGKAGGMLVDQEQGFECASELVAYVQDEHEP